MTAQTDRRTAECDHAADKGCYHCCSLCNYDKHTCPGCDANVPHGTIACASCNGPGAVERLQAPVAQTSPLAEPPPPAPVDLDGTDAAQWYAALREADAQIALYTGIRGRAIEHLQQAMGDAVEARIGGQPAISWKPSKPSMRLDRKALEKDLGTELVARYLRPSAASRPFKVLDTQDGA
jgi:hypothetical protein